MEEAAKIEGLDQLKRQILNNPPPGSTVALQQAVASFKTSNDAKNYIKQLINEYRGNQWSSWYKGYTNPEKYKTLSDFYKHQTNEFERLQQKYKDNKGTTGFTTLRQYLKFIKEKGYNHENNTKTNTHENNTNTHENNTKTGGKHKTRKSKRSRRVTRRRR